MKDDLLVMSLITILVTAGIFLSALCSLKERIAVLETEVKHIKHEIDL